MHRVNFLLNNFKESFEAVAGVVPVGLFDHTTLLDFASSETLLGQKPASWWTRLHDVHLLLATFSIGYANYNCFFNQKLPPPSRNLGDKWGPLVVLQDKRSDLFSEHNLHDFPNADAITRRLKKLVSIVQKMSSDAEVGGEGERKVESASGSDAEEKKKKGKDPIADFEGFDFELDAISPEDRKCIIEFIKLFGLPITGSNGKICYDELRTRLKLSNNFDAKILEKFIQLAIFIAFNYVSEPVNANYHFNPQVHNAHINPYLFLFNPLSADEFLLNICIIRFVRKNFAALSAGPHLAEFKNKLAKLLC